MVLYFVVRVGVVAGLVMASRNYGIWGSQERTKEIYEDVAERTEPLVESLRLRLGIDPPPPPPEGEWRFLGVFFYNQTVLTFFEFLYMVPTYMLYGLERVPGYVQKLVAYARERYEQMKKEREKEACKRCIDERRLVDPHGSQSGTCKRPDSQRPPGLIPKDAPPSPYNGKAPSRPRFPDDDIYKPRLAPKCKCPKCNQREADGWSDQKPKCRNRPEPEPKPKNKSEKQCKICPKLEEEPKKPKKCKICEEKEIEKSKSGPKAPVQEGCP
ncbi:uncharacterized protein LOC115633493 [Scaptodrosophila lebanonensis]|uniref:MICOS complex subunit MIC13 n=1 Tax=Drosophila lebanonensis TaxID=7225 RepID=A0A6J2UFA9_DROLE|nr:uncharacterized protein LOC115633493 [Scaptodrosophila lebanonensis]